MKSVSKPPSSSATPRPPNPESSRLIRRHMKIGWWSLLLFLSAGLELEGLHGFKAALYLNVSNEMRRLLWTLAHAHGTLLSLVHVAFAASLSFIPAWSERARALASSCLSVATILLPGGFFLGGLFLYGADPGLGIILVPAGAVALFVAVLLTARAFSAKS